MWFALFKTLENMPSYGPRPDLPPLSDTRVERFYFRLAREYHDLFEMEFINPVDNLCGALMDLDESDFLDAGQCALLKPWLEERLKGDVIPEFRPVYEKLLEFATRAIELNTGVVVEL